MTDIWQTLREILEARSKGPIGDLLDYVRHMHGDHAADELMDYIQGHDLKDVRRHIALKDMDKRMDRLAGALSSTIASPQARQSSASAPASAQASRTSDKGSGEAEPIPTRPDRDPGAGSQLTRPSPASAGGHAVGSAGLRVKPQGQVASTEFSPVVKPSHPGSFIGQHWQPSAYSAPEPSKKDPETGKVLEPGELEAAKAALDKAKASGDKDTIRSPAMSSRMKDHLKRQR